MAIKFTPLTGLSGEAVLLLNDKKVNFFSSLDWYKNWIKFVSLSPNEHVTFLNYTHGRELKLLLPVIINKYCLESLTNYYSPVFHMLSPDSIDQQAMFKEFLIDLSNDSFKWNTIVFKPMKQELVQDLSTINSIGIPCIPFFCFANWYLEVDQRSFDEYFSGLSSRVRNTVKRKTKQFNRLDGSRIEIISHSEGLEKGIKAFQSVYASSWKDEETFPEFISGLMTIASKQGALRLGIAYLNNVAVAAQLWIVADNTAYIYKLAYDEQYKKLSIGSILTATLMRHVIDIDKVSCVDYLSGDDVYKKEWMSHRRERWGIMIFNWRTLSGCLKMINEYTRFYFKKIFIN